MTGRSESHAGGQKGSPEADEKGVQFTPTSNLIQISLDYLGGRRYLTKSTSKLLAQIKAGEAIWVGINPLTLAPVLMKKDPSLNDGVVDSLTITGPNAGVRLFDAYTSKSVGTVNPTIEALRKGKIVHYKAFLTQQDRHYNGDLNRENERLAANLQLGDPLWMAEHTGYSGEDKEIHPDHLPILQYDPRFALPIFVVKEDSIPARVTEILEEWMVSHPQNLLYMTVAVQKTLQWIWIAQHENLRRDPIERSHSKVPVPFATLSDWLRCAHLYEAFHQVYQLTFYCHPFRFVESILRNPDGGERQDIRPDQLLEELILELAPLAAHPVGLALPCFLRGSTMPDLAALQPQWNYLHRTSTNLAAANQPDWRSMYWSQIGLWGAHIRDAPGFVDITRDLSIPFNWIPTKLSEALGLDEPREQKFPHSTTNRVEDGKHTILDRHDCEGDPRPPILGPSQFIGKRRTLPVVTPLIDRLMASFAAGTPMWAIKGPRVPENANIDSITLSGTQMPRISAEDAFPSRQHQLPPISPSQPRSCPGMELALKPLPGGIIQLTPKELFAAIRGWLWHQNGMRIQWGLSHGFKLEDVLLCEDTGMITFPGLDEDSLIPDRARTPRGGNLALQQQQLLWKDFLSTLDDLSHVPLFMRTLADLAARWTAESTAVEDSQIIQAAELALEKYLMTFLPLHIVHFLLPDKPDPECGWLRGKAGNGKITVDVVGRCLADAFEGSSLQNVDVDIYLIKNLMPAFPNNARIRLTEMFRKVASHEFPLVFRHLFANDFELRRKLADKLAAAFGRYDEINYQTLLLPLPDNLSLGEEGRPSKRARNDGDGLIVFGE